MFWTGLIVGAVVVLIIVGIIVCIIRNIMHKAIGSWFGLG